MVYKFYLFKTADAGLCHTFNDFEKIENPENIREICFDFDGRSFFETEQEELDAEQKMIQFATKLSSLERVELYTEQAYLLVRSPEDKMHRFEVHRKLFYQFLRNLPHSEQVIVDFRLAHLEFLEMPEDITILSIRLQYPTQLLSVRKTIGNYLVYDPRKKEQESESESDSESDVVKRNKFKYDYVLEWLEKYDPDYEKDNMYQIVCNAKIQNYNFVQWVYYRSPSHIKNPIIRKIIHISFPNTNYRPTDEQINVTKCNFKSNLSQSELYYRSSFYINDNEKVVPVVSVENVIELDELKLPIENVIELPDEQVNPVNNKTSDSFVSRLINFMFNWY